MSSHRSTGVKRGCKLCRLTHSKCGDREQPRCGRCTRVGKDCVRDPPYRFLSSREGEQEATESNAEGHSAVEYSKEQTWIETPKELEFVFETLGKRKPQHLHTKSTIRSDTAFSKSPYFSAASTQSSSLNPRYLDAGPSAVPDLADSAQYSRHSIQPGPLSPAREDLHLTPPVTPARDAAEAVDTYAAAVVETPSAVAGDGASRISQESSYSNFRGQHEVRRKACNSFDLSALYGDSGTVCKANPWQLTGPDEAMLIRYFVTNLSHFFDYCDPQRTFSTTIVQRAVGCPTLLLAILTVSSRHLSLSRGLDLYLSDQYHRDCLSLLIPMLDDRNTLWDESICAATVILRLYEELSVTLLGKDTCSHLLGSHIFLLAQEVCPSDIRQAASKVALRQEINVAFCTRKPMQLLTKYTEIVHTTNLRSDWDWTMDMIVLCAEVVNYCYCNTTKDSTQPWAELCTRAENWLEKKPASFEPLRCQKRNRSNSIFPDIWLLNDCHVAGHIYFLMCHILLTAYNPLHPRLGPDRAKAMRLTDEIMRDDVRKVCGIALSNPHAQPSMFQACTVILICGDLFTDRTEQDALLHLLIQTEADLAWPTASSQNYLKERWGWS